MPRFSVVMLLVLIGNLIPPAPLASEGWKLVQDKADVKIYSRNVEGHSEAEFKGVSVLNNPIAVVGAVLADIPAYTKWFYNCLEIKKIPRQGSTDLEFFLYVAVKTPWPIQDRDIVYRVTTAVDRDRGQVLVTSAALSETLIPLRPQYVRITDSVHRWVLERTAPNQTRVTFINRTDPAGSLPTYWVDFGNHKTTYESLMNMREIVKEPKYAKLGQKLHQRYTP